MKKYSITKRIQISFLLVIIPVLLLTFAVFTVVVRGYLDRAAKIEINSSINAAAAVIDSESGHKLMELPDFVMRLNAALSELKLSQNNEIVILTKDFNILYPNEQYAYINPAELTEKVLPKLKMTVPYLVNRQIWKISAGADNFYISVHRVDGYFDGKAEYLVLLRSNSYSTGLVRTLSLVLLLILFTAAAIVIPASALLSRGLSKPIRQLRDYARTIGDRDFRRLSFEEYSPELHELAESMNEMAGKLESYDLEQKTFFQNASHELRTPLTSIRGYAEGLKTDVFKDPARAADIILKESDRLSLLVDELLVLSRLDSQRTPGKIAPVDLGELLRNVAEDLGATAAGRGVAIGADTAGVSAIVEADAEYLRRAVLNIVSNCIRYARSEVRVSLARQGRHAVITVSDDGTGLGDADIENIFKRFYKGPGGQHGLGLSIAKAAVERFGGTISARNKPGGGGAEFTIRLDIKQEHDT